MKDVLDRIEVRDIDQTAQQLKENFSNVLVIILKMTVDATEATTRKRSMDYFVKLLMEEDVFESHRWRLHYLHAQVGHSWVLCTQRSIL